MDDVGILVVLGIGCVLGVVLVVGVGVLLVVGVVGVVGVVVGVGIGVVVVLFGLRLLSRLARLFCGSCLCSFSVDLSLFSVLGLFLCVVVSCWCMWDRFVVEVFCVCVFMMLVSVL